MRVVSKINKFIFLVSFFTYAGYNAGLALIIAAQHIELSRYYSVPLRILLMILMTILIVKNRNNGRQLFKNIYLPFMILFAMIYVIKVVMTDANYHDDLSRNWYEYIFYFIAYSITPFFAFAFIDLKKYKRTILNSFIFSGFILGMFSLYLYKDILVMGIGRISMIQYDFPNRETLSPLSLSYSGALTIVLCIYKLLYMTNSLKIKLYLYGVIILSFIMFYLGASRGSLVAILLSIPLLIYYKSTTNKIKVLILFIVAIPFVIYGAKITGSAIFARSENTIQTGDASGRQQLYVAAFSEFLSNPIIGGRIEVSRIYPHNVFLEILMATGLLGFVLFVSIFIKSIQRGITMSKKDDSYLVPVLILTTGVSEGMFSGAIYGAILLFTSMGMIFSTYNSFRSKKSKVELVNTFRDDY